MRIHKYNLKFRLHNKNIEALYGYCSDEQDIKILCQYNPAVETTFFHQGVSKPQKRLTYYKTLKMLKHKSIRRFAVLSGVRRADMTTIICVDSVNIRNPLLMEKLFLSLYMNSTEIFNAVTASKELENISVATIEKYTAALEMSNLIYLAKPMNIGRILRTFKIKKWR